MKNIAYRVLDSLLRSLCFQSETISANFKKDNRHTGEGRYPGKFLQLIILDAGLRRHDVLLCYSDLFRTVLRVCGNPLSPRIVISYLIFIIGLLSFVLTFPTVASGAEARIAVASNFIATIKRLKPQFEQQSGHKLTLHFGSTGKLYAQIINGAPFDVFLAADAVRPKKLEADGKAVAGSRFTYATGVLALWVAEALVQPEKGKTAKTIFEQDEIKRISMTNPKLAPYGMAAKQFLQASNYWDKYQTRLLLGNNVAQTLQFVQSGGVGAGFIALAQVAAEKRNSASVWIIPAEKYMPLQQQAVLLKQGDDNLAAKAFIQFLKTEEVVKQIEEAGYSLEKEVNAKEGHGKEGDKKEKGSD